MPASLVHSATVAHSGILTGLTDGSAIGFITSGLVLAAFGMEHGRPSHRRHLQQCSLHHVCASIGLAAHIDPARHPLATERLAIDGGVEATQRDNGRSAFRPAPTFSRLRRRLTF